jgi:DNA polymerase
LKKWEEFKRYCARDVEAEREIDLQLLKYEPPQFERINYIIDQQINDRGILIDLAMVKSALEMDNHFRKEVIQRLKDTTGIENPNSASQMKEWLSNALGKIIKTLAKDSVIELLNKSEDAAVSDALKGRMKLAKTSTKKYASMMDCVCEDGRAHGLFQFYGANRTGRWAGRLIQLQNLPRNHMKDIESARGVVASGDYDLAKMLYESIPNVLSELIRTAFVAAKGKTFVVADFSAIEARVLSWVAQEKWRMDVFEKHGKIYEASAAMMFGAPIETVTKGSDLRQRGKIAELALGYQGSVGAMGKLDVKMPPEERQELVYKWRKSNPRIVKLWHEVQENAIIAIKTQREVQTQFLNYDCDGNVFTIQLPSGRKLFYQKPRIVINKFGREAMEFMGIDQAIKKWKAIDTYGGKMVENIVQAISRDLLAYSMQRLDAEGFDMVMHVHDEIICESPEHDSKDDLQMMCNIMGEAVPWAKGLPLVADGYVTKFYKKQ